MTGDEPTAGLTRPVATADDGADREVPAPYPRPLLATGDIGQMMALPAAREAFVAMVADRDGGPLAARPVPPADPGADLVDAEDVPAPEHPGPRAAPAGRVVAEAPAEAHRSPPAPEVAVSTPPISSPLVVDHHVHEVVGRALQGPVPGVDVHADPRSDAVLHGAGADGLAFADHLLVRRDVQDGDASMAGTALLAHELHHAAAAARRPSAGPPQDDGAQAAEEVEARRVERAVLAMAPPQGPDPPMAAAAVDRAAALTGHEPHRAPVMAARPVARAPMPVDGRAALVEREVASPAGAPPTMVAMPEAQLRQLKDELYRELLDRLRTDFERGS